MGWYTAPNCLAQSLQAELLELSKAGDSQMNAILQVIGDLEDYDDEVEAIEMITSICDEFVVAAKTVRKLAIKHKPVGWVGFPGYKLSENQKLFVADAEAAGLGVDYDYSSRGMEGKYCPAVRVDRGADFKTDADYFVESTGLGVVVYARS